MNLASNHTHTCHPCDPLPENITSLVNTLYNDRDSLNLSLDIRNDRDLYDLSIGAGEPDVEKYFHAHIFG